MRPKAALFDAYGTLLDVYSVAATAERLWPGSGSELSSLWRDKQVCSVARAAGDVPTLAARAPPPPVQPRSSCCRPATGELK